MTSPPMPAAKRAELMATTSLNEESSRSVSSLLKRRSDTSAERSPPVSVMSATSRATAVPCPMAIPTSASESAGASFTPSPTIATVRPSAFRRSTNACLSSGSRFASNSVTPASAAMRAAVRSLSPVSITTRSNPSARSSATARATPSLSGSSMPMTPTSSPSTAKYRGERPSDSRATRSACSAEMGTPSSSTTKCSDPMTTRLPSSDEAMPWATMYSTSACRSRCLRFFSAAARTTARATGWGKCSSRQAARRSTSRRFHPSSASTHATFGVASVRVPVLSNTMVSARAMASKCFDPFTVKPA